MAPLRTSRARFRFKRFGAFPHLVIDSAETLRLVGELDAAHWLALSAPIHRIRSDPRFLELLDTNGEGIVTHADVTTAVAWFFSVFRSFEGLESRSGTVNPNSFNSDNADGHRIRNTLEKIRRRENLGADSPIPLSTIQESIREIALQPTGSRGVIHPEAAEDPGLKRMLNLAVSVTGGTDHPSGETGIDAHTLEQFTNQVRDYLTWRTAASDDVYPLGEKTEDTYHRHRTLIGKIDHFFALCNAAVFDGRVEANIYFDEATLGELKDSSFSELQSRLMKAPLAVPDSRGVLRLDDANLCYRRELEDFRKTIVQPLIGDVGNEITFEQWMQIRDKLAPYEQWLTGRPQSAGALAEEEAVERFIEPIFIERAMRLLESGSEEALEIEDMVLAEQAALYQAHLLELCNNFVSFPNLYHRKDRALFEMGSLIMDGRYFNLALQVEERGRHATVARNSGMYLMYMAVYERPGQTKYEVAVPVTSGGRGNIVLGKHGIFVDLSGEEYDAEVIEIIENPVSFREAVGAPFRRLGRLISGKIEAATSEAQNNLDREFVGHLSRTEAQQPAATTSSGAAQQPPKNGSRFLSRGGLLLGGGVAIAAIGSALAYIVNTLARLQWYEILIGLAAAAGAVLFPVAILAVLKLKRRDISAIVEASGWAMNGRMRLTRALSGSLTVRPGYPKGSKGTRSFARKLWIITIAVLLLSSIAVLIGMAL